MKREKRTLIILLIFLLFLLFIMNYTFLDNLVENSLLNRESFVVERIIDGDTIVANGEYIRLLGINSPEKGEKYYDEAKQYLENLLINKTIQLEYGKEQRDKYGRILAYIYDGDTLINQKLILNGYANIYFPSGKDNYYGLFLNSWRECIKNNQNLCEKSTSVEAHCIEIFEFDTENQEVIFRNKCERDLNLDYWKIKDEGRKRYFFPIFTAKKYDYFTVKVGEEDSSENVLYWRGEDYVWTETGDSLFLRDDQDKLILWYSY